MTPLRPGWLLATLSMVISLSACDGHVPPQHGAAQGRDAPFKLDLLFAQADEAGLRQTDGVRQDVAEMQANAQDAAITVRVNGALMSDGQLSGLQIQVSTQGGTVTLRGHAPDALVIARATELASAVEGVMSVVNEIKVSTTLSETGEGGTTVRLVV